MTTETPSRKECEQIWEHYHTPEQVREHCQAVSRLACEYGKKLKEAGCSVDLDLIFSASLLHDVARQKRDHPEEEAKIAVREGYPALAPVIRRHHDWNRGEGWSWEAAVLYLADKEMQGTEQITLAERFARSRKRCRECGEPQEALAAHERRYREARQVEERIRLRLVE